MTKAFYKEEFGAEAFYNKHKDLIDVIPTRKEIALQSYVAGYRRAMEASEKKLNRQLHENDKPRIPKTSEREEEPHYAYGPQE